MQFRLHQSLHTNKAKIDQADGILHDNAKTLTKYKNKNIPKTKRQCLQIPCLSPEVKVQMASVNTYP